MKFPVNKESDLYKSLTGSGPIALLAGIIVLALGSIHWVAANHQEVKQGIDLRKGWTPCLTTDFAKGAKRCEKEVIDFPNYGSSTFKETNAREVEYIHHFLSPDYCLDAKTQGCVFYVGGAFQGAHFFLNGQNLGQYFTESDLYPFSFLLPRPLLKAPGVPNEIRLLLYTVRPELFPSVTQGPVGVMPLEVSRQNTLEILGERIVLPIVSAGLNVTFAITGLFWLLSRNSARTISVYFVFYCISTAFYMLSATLIGWEYLSHHAVASLHFGLRYLMEFSGFGLVTTFFSTLSRKVKFIRGLYIFAFGSFFTILLLSLINPGVEVFLNRICLGPKTLPVLRYRDAVFLLSYCFVPLMIVGKLFAFYHSFRLYIKVPGAKVLFFLFLIVVPMQFTDLLTFIGLIRVDLEIYYIRLYTPFVSLAFAYVIWLKWIENETQTEATLRVGEVAQGVAHDLRSPTTALKILSRTCKDLKPDEQFLLSHSMETIEMIISSLLDMYRGKESKFKSVEKYLSLRCIKKLVLDVVNNKNFILESQGRKKVIFECHESETEVFQCNVNVSDLGRALDNVINNAIEVSRSNEESSTVVRFSKIGDRVQVEVSDSGDPIDVELLRKLNRKEFNFSTKASGHGIGLREVWRIVQSHKGDLRFEKPQKVGMTVVIDLPLAVQVCDLRS